MADATARSPYIEQHRILSVQILRGLAIVMVALWHSALIGSGTLGLLSGWLPRPLALGFGGVDIFFAISGFICCMVTSRRPTGAWLFLKRRAARILPFNILFSLPYLALLLLVPAMAHGRGDVAYVFSSLLSFPDPLLVAGQDPRPLIPSGWSLQNEMIFYVLTALLFGRHPRRLAAVLVGLFGIGIAVHVVPYEVAGRKLNDLKLVSLYHLEFAAGVLAFAVRDRIRAAWGPALLIAAGGAYVATGLALAALGPADGSVPVTPFGWFGLVRVIGFAIVGFCLLTGGLTLEDRLRRRAAHRRVAWPVLLGEASYIFYLCHELIFGAVGRLSARIGGGAVTLAATVAIAWGIAIGFAILFHLFVERRSVRWLERRVSSPRAAASA